MSSSFSVGSTSSPGRSRRALDRDDLVGVAHGLDAQRAVERPDRHEVLLAPAARSGRPPPSAARSSPRRSSRYGFGRAAIGDEVVRVARSRSGRSAARSTKSSISIVRLAFGASVSSSSSLDHDVLAGRDLVALHDLLVGDLVAGRLGDPPVADPGAGALLELVEPDVLRPHGRHELHRHGHQPEADRSRSRWRWAPGPPPYAARRPL